VLSGDIVADGEVDGEYGLVHVEDNLVGLRYGFVQEAGVVAGCDEAVEQPQLRYDGPGRIWIGLQYGGVEI